MRSTVLQRIVVPIESLFNILSQKIHLFRYPRRNETATRPIRFPADHCRRMLVAPRHLRRLRHGEARSLGSILG